MLWAIILFICTGLLSGCTEQSNSENDKTSEIAKVKLIDTDYERHSTIVGWYDYYKGTIKNVAGYMLNGVSVTVKFYDENDHFLFKRTDTIYYLANTYTKEFSVTVHSYDDYAENIDYVKYEFLAL